MSVATSSASVVDSSLPTSADIIDEPIDSVTQPETDATDNGSTDTAETQPETTGKKRGPKAGSKRPGAKIEFGVPEGKFLSKETPGFECRFENKGGHKKLKPEDFACPMDWFEWQLWYHNEFARMAKYERDEYRALGDTEEQRALNVDLNAALNAGLSKLKSNESTAVAKPKATNAMIDKMREMQAELARVIAESMAANAEAEATEQAEASAQQSVVIEVSETVSETVVNETKSNKRKR